MSNSYAIDAMSALEAAATAKDYLDDLLRAPQGERDNGRIKAANDAIGHGFRRAEVSAALAQWEELRGIRTALSAIAAHGEHAAQFTGQGLTLAQRLEEARRG